MSPDIVDEANPVFAQRGGVAIPLTLTMTPTFRVNRHGACRSESNPRRFHIARMEPFKRGMRSSMPLVPLVSTDDGS